MFHEYNQNNVLRTIHFLTTIFNLAVNLIGIIIIIINVAILITAYKTLILVITFVIIIPG